MKSVCASRKDFPKRRHLINKDECELTGGWGVGSQVRSAPAWVNAECVKPHSVLRVQEVALHCWFLKYMGKG